MKKTQFDTLVIDVMDRDQYNLPIHSHTYYELIYVIKGYGQHFLNNNVFNYKVGDLYLISPEDSHYFVFHKASKLIYIKFTDAYFQDNQHLSPDNFSVNSPLNVMRKQILKEEKLIFGEPCKSILRKTVENIVAYNEKKDIANSPLIFFQILSIFGLIREAADKNKLRIEDGMPNKEDLISYINQHIYRPAEIRVKSVANHFNISPHYFSNYFRRNFGMSYREYINDYRIKLLERRIQANQNTIKQIADEFGFTDESHLTNYFKKIKNISPTNFRNQQ